MSSVFFARMSIAAKLLVGLGLSAKLIGSNAEAAMNWRWSVVGEGFQAEGQLTTADAPDANGFYEIIAISGDASGVAITGLQPARTAIPGNDGWPIDNLIRSRPPQLSHAGFGFALADGTFVNPFYGERFEPPGFLAVITNPERKAWREPRVEFTATKTSP